MHSAASQVLLHLSLIESLGPGLGQRLVRHFGVEQLTALYNASAHELTRIAGVSETAATKIVKGLADRSVLETELELLEKHKISWVSIIESDYPLLLSPIHLPPIVLYWKGTLPGEQSIAIVGSREANSYGKYAVERLLIPLVGQEWGIISGGALGIDTMAHQTTVDAGGITCAVLGSGILVPYPPENKELFNTICTNGGAVISPFPLLMKPLQGNFPARNRVIAGLAKGCVVVQAAIKSGARITAEFSLQQGRTVFAVPGPIDDPLSVGCHELIAQGATIATCAQDILVEFGQEIQEQIVDTTDQQTSLLPIIKPLPLHQDPMFAAILEVCKQPNSIDELIEKTNIPLAQLTPILFDLQLKGYISQNMAGLWQK